jgi:hypothetical protein
MNTINNQLGSVLCKSISMKEKAKRFNLLSLDFRWSPIDCCSDQKDKKEIAAEIAAEIASKTNL